MKKKTTRKTRRKTTRKRARKKRPAAAIATRPADPLVDSPPHVDCLRWYLEGKRDHDIIRDLRRDHPDADAESVCRYVAEYFRQVGQLPIESIDGLAIARANELFCRAMAAGDFSAATRALKLIHTIAHQSRDADPYVDTDQQPETTDVARNPAAGDDGV